VSASYQTYEEFMKGRKPKAQKRVTARRRLTATPAEWNAAVNAGKVTSMQLQLYKAVKHGQGLHSGPAAYAAKRIEKGYL